MSSPGGASEWSADGDPVAGFSPVTRTWFTETFPAATAAQGATWATLPSGTNVLVVAPTGSGKTLAAFLASLDRLAAGPPPGDPRRRCRVLYVSPLKALAVDIERNLRTPLAGIGRTARRLGLAAPDISVGVRTGDTPAAARRTFARTPPDILITTPESLFLVLTSAAREALRGVETVIVDEVHAVCATKRGAHLALSLERLDALLDRPAQRIGLSATVRPVDEVARFLGGARPVTVVAPPAAKTVDVRVEVSVEDMTALDEAPAGPEASADPRGGSIWPSVEVRVADLIAAHRSTIVFVNSRRVAERLCARVNERAAGLPTRPRPAWTPAQVMGQSPTAEGAPPTVARAHHGSVSREERREIEDALKAGRLRAVVATSSLELGIDMGAVDLVVQVAAPPSVAAGLQRVGRAGHQVGAVSSGVVFPTHRADLLASAVVAGRMTAGAIEAVRYPRNPLDVLAQQIVAMTAMEPWTVGDLAAVVRRAAPYAELSDAVLESVLDMLAGRYPSDDFAELRPRLVWDRTGGHDTDAEALGGTAAEPLGGTLSARPGAHRLAVTSGGTIPDRGLYGVFLAGDGSRRRVGELDEEMVYESRVGDVFLLGSSSWLIEAITPDQVLVSPAPGQAARMPFWKGDIAGRPLELGRAIGAFVREVAALDEATATDRLTAAGLGREATANLLGYLDEQRQSTGQLPDDRTLVVERFHDELGDWRVVVHSLFGTPVNGPWALAVAARLRERLGIDVQALHTDDGIMLRLPDLPDDQAPDVDLAVFAPEEIADLVTAEVGGSAMFAARFRECAARALLLPRPRPGRRAPLWQQRHRAAQLLGVAAQFDAFPIVLETMRECLQDVFDLPGLTEVLGEVQTGRLRLVEVTTAGPSPFARAMMLSYVGAFLYEGDTPLAERRAQALTLDSTVLAELLGRAQLRQLLDPAVLVATGRELQRLPPERPPRHADDCADLLRLLGGLTTAELVERGAEPRWLDELAAARRAIGVQVAGEQRWIAVEDASRVRDALGAALPDGLPPAFTRPVADPLGDLVSRYARTHGPFPAVDCAARFGLGVAVVEPVLERLAAAGRLVTGEFRPDGTGPEWCDAEVLRTLRRRSLAASRREAQPVAAEDYARFLVRWQRVAGSAPPDVGRRGRFPDRSALVRAVEQLQGVPVPASALEHPVLAARVEGYAAALLDELCASGEVVWAGAGPLPGHDGWVQLALRDEAALVLRPPTPRPWTALHRRVLDALDSGRALFFRTLSDAIGGTDDTALVGALWDLVWAGEITNDTLAPLRASLAGGRRRRSGHRAVPSGRSGRPGRVALPTRAGPPAGAGRWSRLPERSTDATRRAHAAATTLLARYGVVTPGVVAGEGLPGGFSGVYPVLSAMADAGRVRRGYFVAGLGGAQFAEPGTVERLRAVAAGHGQAGEDGRAGRAGEAVVLAAIDPANPYGAALPWPERTPTGVPGPGSVAGEPPGGRGHQPGRRAGAWVALVDGRLVLYVERGGRTVLSWSDAPATLTAAVRALAGAVRAGWLDSLTIERVDGRPVVASGLGGTLRDAGFRPTPRGLRLRP